MNTAGRPSLTIFDCLILASLPKFARDNRPFAQLPQFNRYNLPNISATTGIELFPDGIRNHPLPSAVNRADMLARDSTDRSRR